MVSGKEKGSNGLNDAWFPGCLGSLWGTYTVVVALHWQSERLLRETAETHTKQGRQAHMSLRYRLTDSPIHTSWKPSNHQTQENAAVSTVGSKLLQSRHVKYSKPNCFIWNKELLQSYGSNSTDDGEDPEYRQNQQNSWTESVRTHVSFLKMTLPNFRVRWPKMIKDRNSNIYSLQFAKKDGWKSVSPVRIDIQRKRRKK